MTQKFGTAEIYKIVLEAGGSLYICSSAVIQMAVNDLPTADVVISSGVALDPEEAKTYRDIESAENLLYKVLSERSDVYTDMVECKQYEEDSINPLFTGVIVTGSLLYKAGLPTVKAVRFHCVHGACRLWTKPLQEYVNITGAGFINYAAEGSQFTVQKAQENSDNLHKGRIPADTLISSLSLDQMPLDKIVGQITDKILLSGSYTNKDDMTTDGNLFGVLDYITSNYRLNYKELGGEAEQRFQKQLCNSLQQTMVNSSVLESIYSILNSTEYMLNIVPKWSEGFKLHIMPSQAWSNTTAIRITGDSVISLDTRYNPLACLDTPEGFIVSFSSAANMLANEQDLDYLGSAGVYSSVPALQKYLVNRFQGKKNVSIDKDLENAFIRARIYRAPRWLTGAFLEKAIPSRTEKTESGGDKVKSVKDLQRKKRPDGETPKPDVAMDKNKATAIADKIAKALFVHLYGTQDIAEVSLLPSLRYGRSGIGTLEDNLGNIVEIAVQNTDGSGSIISLKGELQSIRYEYMNETAGSANYTIRIGRVRPIDSKAETVVCPLYEKIEEWE